MIENEHLWMVVLGFIIAFVLALGIGANDVANSFGTSVGARVLTLKQACILACIFETLGAVLLGSKVSDTIRTGIIDVAPYANKTEVLMMGNVAALSGSGVWLIAATLLRMPVSATHSIVGATVGFAFVTHGTRGINWRKLGMIGEFVPCIKCMCVVGSWFISPLLAGLVSTGIFFVIHTCILSRERPVECGLRLLPAIYGATIVINFFSVFYDGPEILYFHKIPLWGTFVISLGSGVICVGVARLLVVPWIRRKIQEKSTEIGGEAESEKMGSDDVIDTSPSDLSLNSSIDIGPLNQNGVEKLSELTFTEEITEIPGKRSNLKTRKGPANGIKPGDIKTPPLDDLFPLTAAKKEYSSVDKEFCANVCLEKLDSCNGRQPRNSSEDKEVLLGPQGRGAVQDRPDTASLFSVLQVLTAVFSSFVHGGNDVSNAVGPLVSLWLLSTHGAVSDSAATPIWTLLYGGVGISLGMCLFGRRVIKTMGEDLTRVTPSSGFCIEIGSALTVLVANTIGIPISTTHCKVGSVVLVGRFRSRENVDWSIFGNIVLAWLVTLPVCLGVSTAIMTAMMKLNPL